MASESYPFTEHCVRGSRPHCECDCPLNFDVRGFLKKLESGVTTSAYKIMLDSMVFPGIVSEVCPAYCGGQCPGHIHIHELERYCIAKTPAAKRGAPRYTIPPETIQGGSHRSRTFRPDLCPAAGGEKLQGHSV